MTDRRVHGPAVRAIRIALGLLSKTVADDIGMDRGHYSRLEAGKRQANPLTVAALARRLGVTVDQITYPAAADRGEAA